MKASHRITVSGDRLTFAAAHMATFGDDLEPLHGHSYSVTVEVRGPLTADSLVHDFGDLRRAASDVISGLDHRFILQKESTLLGIESDELGWRIRHGSRIYTFPRADVAALPIDNSTAERLAEWIAGRLRDRLGDGFDFVDLSVGVAEGPGQSGWYTVGT